MADPAETIAALRGAAPASYTGLFRIPRFSRMWRAMLVSSIGDWVGFVAVASLVTKIGGEAAGFAVAGLMIARLLPSLLFGPFAGVLVDRFNRGRLMVVADVTRAAAYAAVPFLPNLPTIFAVSFGIECLSLVWTPARDASIPKLVPRRQLANASSLGLVSSYGTLP
ncbi:MAG: MFS transporter, partial [Actinomycetota bacterium]|nr:MFS transporter [Actinomycetota bacterium]